MKIEEQVLSREQMAHLKELGVDTSDASMYWIRAERMEGFRKHNLIDNDLGKWRLSLSRKLIVPAAWKVEYIPTYTIGDLINKLPSNIDGCGFKATIEKSPNYNYPKTEVVYDNEGVCTEYISSKENPIHALYGFLCYVAQYHKELIK